MIKETNSAKSLNVHKQSVRNGKIDLFRFLFSVAIAIFHFNCSVKYPNEIFSKAYIAVEFFFLVSGYLMAKSISKLDKQNNIDVVKESLTFMKNKYLSFFPYHIFIVVITVAAWIPYFNLSLTDWAVKVANAIPAFLLLQMFGFNSADWLFPEWYLSAMIIVMFILTPVMIKYRRIYSYYIAPVVSLIAISIVFKYKDTLDVTTAWNGFVCLGLLRAFGEISLGFTIYAVAESGIIEKFNKYFLLLTELICYICIFIYMNKTLNPSIEISILFLFIIAVTISFSPKASCRFLNNKVIYFLGKISLPIYLCHSLVRYYITKNVWTHGGYASYLVFFLIITLVLSLICLLTVDGIKYLISKRKHIKETNI